MWYDPREETRFELSSIMPCVIHLAIIFIFSHLWPLKYYLFGRNISFSFFMPKTFEIVYTFVCIQNANTHEVLHGSHKYFTFVSHFCSFSSIIPSVFLVGSHVFSAIKVLLQFINILHLVAIFVLSDHWQLMYSSFGRHIYFSLSMPITTLMCIYTQY